MYPLYGVSKKLTELERYAIASGQAKFTSDIIIDEDILSCAVARFILDDKRYNEWDFEVIVADERFIYPITDYKLSKLTDIDFSQSGFIFDKKYYLYNIFIDRRQIDFFDEMPAVFQLITNNIELRNADFYMRLDERLAIPSSEADILHILVFEKFRGPSFRFASTKLERMKKLLYITILIP